MKRMPTNPHTVLASALTSLGVDSVRPRRACETHTSITGIEMAEMAENTMKPRFAGTYDRPAFQPATVVSPA